MRKTLSEVNALGTFTATDDVFSPFDAHRVVLVHGSVGRLRKSLVLGRYNTWFVTSIAISGAA